MDAPLHPAPNRALLRWLVWSPALALLFSATVVVGGLVFFLLPLGGLAYGVFALVASLGSRREVR